MPPPEDPDWKRNLLCHPNSYTPKANTANAFHAFTHAPEWKGVLWFDEFRYRNMIGSPPPWEGAAGNRPMKDEDAIHAAMWLQHQGIDVRVTTAEQALVAAAQQDRRNPLRESLSAIEWDGIPRVGSWLTDYLGIESTPLSQHIGRCWLVSAIARAFEPGCQADHCIVFEGRQGLGKSSALRALAGEEWFAVHVAQSLANRDAAIQCSGVWIMEFSELQSIRGRAEEVKSFISRRTDHYRPLFGRQAIDVPRQCVFAGTTNEDCYLDDDTGGRRYWPVHCTRPISVDALAGDRDQVWAEAVTLYRSGAKWHLSRAMEQEAGQAQRDRLATDVWLTEIEKYIQGKESVSAEELLLDAIGMKLTETNSHFKRRAVSCLRTLGWASSRIPGSGIRRWKPPARPRHRPSLDPDKAVL